MNQTKLMIASAALVGAVLASATAQAQYFDPRGSQFFDQRLPPPPPFGRGFAPGYGGPRYEEPQGYGPISCGEGAQIIAEQGFRNISVRECSGRVFRYTAYRRGAPFEVRVSSRTGQITMIRAI